MKTERMQKRAIGNGRQWVLLLCILCSNAIVQGQKNDTLSVLREFILISNAYKQLPLDLGLELRNSTNFITAENDTSTVEGVFYLRDGHSYVRFGEFEQVINDSMALLVSDKLQQMILYTNAGPVISSIKNMMGVTLPDSSLRHMAARYMSSVKREARESSVIILESRAVVLSTSLPKETITMRYDAVKKLPQEVLTIKRNLVLLDSLQYSSLQNRAETAGKLLHLEGSYFLVKEQTTAFIYKTIEHPSASPVPVAMANRIMRTTEGAYKPVKEYETYGLTQN